MVEAEEDEEAAAEEMEDALDLATAVGVDETRNVDELGFDENLSTHPPQKL